MKGGWGLGDCGCTVEVLVSSTGMAPIVMARPPTATKTNPRSAEGSYLGEREC